MGFHKFNDFNWDGIDKIEYKKANITGPMTFNATDRQNLVADGQNTAFHLRYFESAPGGYSSLEKHEHVHVVVAMRGKGIVIMDNEVHEVEPFDLIVIPSWSRHQLVNASDTEPFGFFCTVNGDRDKYQTLTREEVDELKKNPEVASAIRVNERYWG